MHHVDTSSATGRWLHWTQVGPDWDLVGNQICRKKSIKFRDFFFGGRGFKMVGFLDFGTFSVFSLWRRFFLQMGNLAVESEATVL